MGKININGCPNAFCSDVANFATLSDLFVKGLPPVGGGSLDQAVWFLEASRFLQSDEAKIARDVE